MFPHLIMVLSKETKALSWSLAYIFPELKEISQVR